MKFKSLSDYLAAFRKGEADAIVPTDAVAKHFDVKSKTIDGRLKRGSLKKVSIGKDKYVSAQGILQLEDAELKTVEKIEKHLNKLVDQGKGPIFYADLMKHVGLKSKSPHDRGVIGDLLGKVSRRSHAKDKTLLSVMVHNKKKGDSIPNDSFFALADELGYSTSAKRKSSDKVKWAQNHMAKLTKLRGRD